MILLPGSGGFHSKILWWDQGSNYNETQLQGKVAGWNWNVNDDDCESFGSLPQFTLDPAPYNIFCSSFTHLHDGRALLAGGTAIGEIGSRKSVYFDPTQASPWSEVANPMASRRWYPTAQLLPRGEALVSSGSQYHHMIAWGGTSTPGSAAAAQGDLHRLQLTDAPAWDPAIPWRDATDWPSKRYGHSLVAVDPFAMAIVGGRRSNGLYVMDAWILRVDAQPTQSDFHYYWQELTVHPTSQLPDGRIGHTAFFLNDGTLIVYGGRDDVGVFNQVWRRYTDGGLLKWEQLTQEPVSPGGPLPGGRFGHTLAYQSSTQPPVRNRALVFGGATTLAGALADADVWELTIDLQSSPRKAKWRKLALEAGSPTSPVARYEHAMTPGPWPLKRTPLGPDMWHFYLSGGRGSFGPGVSLSNQFWRLWDVDINTVAWEQLPSAPTARAGHSLVYDVSVHRLVTMGGDTGGATSDNSLWGIFVEEMVWTDETPATGSPSTSGHIAFFTPGRVFARKPERLTPGPGSSGTWEPPIAAPLIQEWYPFHFTIANGPHAGKIFNAGPSAPTYLLDLSAPGWTAWPATSGFKGGSAVIYGPDRVMKCGSRDTEGGLPPPPGIGTTKFIVLDQAGASWASSSPMDSGRVNHNLTLLPSGEVLVTGGTELVTDAAIGGRARGLVELWRPPDATYPNGVWYGGHETTTRPRCCSRMDGS